MAFEVRFEQSGDVFPCRDDESVLAAMAAANRSTLQVGCRSGGCGVCRVQVLDGRYDTGLMSSDQVPACDRARGNALACKLFPRQNLRLRALGLPSCSNGDEAAERIRRLIRSVPSASLSPSPANSTAGRA